MILDRFKVPKGEEVRVAEAPLRQTVQAIFEKMGVPTEDAAIGADVLTMTDLRGVETHGVSNMLRIYVQGYREGTINATPNLRVERESPSTATLDADWGLGIIVGPKAMRMAIEKAKQVGVGIVTMHSSGHLGAVGHHAMLAAEAGMVGVCMTASAGLSVVPTFASKPLFSTNPLAIAAPARNEAPVYFDVATSAIAGNKIRLAMRVESPLLPGWVADKEGNPITEEAMVYDRGQFLQLPLGGTREQGSHKGYGLALMVEILSTLLSGGMPIMLERGSGSKSYFAAYDVAAFTDPERFLTTMDDMLKTLRTTEPIRGQERVLYPGLSEYEEVQERRANGIPLHKEVIQWFNQITAELGLPALETL
jgi:LDH2 family malate/lactate/ureidoglycolate dehydrogenase